MAKRPFRVASAHDLELKLTNALADERLRTARDIHAGVLQRLVAMRMQISTALELVGDADAPALSAIAGAIDGAIKELRDTISSAEPRLISSAGLGGALSQAFTDSASQVTIHDRRHRRHPMRAELAVYFASREAAHNAIRHAGNGTTVAIDLTDSAGALAFDVTDDGAGFDPARTTRGVGLFNIRERIAAAGGSVRISSTPGSGARVCGSVPDVLSEPSVGVDGASERYVLLRQIVLETDAERRRIMRDLHDGAQQSLVALRVRIGLAAERTADTPGDEALLDRLARELDAAIAELRDLARGLLLPASHSAVGPALLSVTRHWPMAVQVRERRIGPRDAAVDNAVYRCCLEALQNARATDVVPNARQARASVSIFERDSAVHFVVRGTTVFDPGSAGARRSISSMTDRAAVAGGELTVSTLGTQGHVVRGYIPVAAAL